MSMKWKIILPMAGILTALFIVTTVSSTLRFTRFTRMLFNERITVSTNGLKNFLDDSAENSRIAAISASNDANIIAAINNRDKDEITRLLLDSLNLYPVNFFTVTDETGIVLARTHSEKMYGDSIMNQRNIREALNNNIYTCMEEGTIAKTSCRTGAPVYNKDGRLIGVISAGVRFDTDDMVDRLKELYNADFSIIINNTRFTTTISRNGERLTGSPIDPITTNQIQTTKKEYFGNIDILGENYSMYYLPLLDEQGEIYAIIAVGCSNAKLISEKNALQKNVIIIGLSGLIICIVMLLLITAKIVKPVNQVARLVSEVTAGNMNVDIVRTGIKKDEIGLLTHDIYSLVDVIKLILSDLSLVTVDLNKFTGFDYQIDTRKYSGSYKEIIGGINKLADSITISRKTMAVMDYLDTMISVVDFDYNILYINRNMADSYGIDRENCIGKKCYKTIRNLDQPCTICQMQKLMPEKETYPSIDYDSLLDESSGTYVGGRAAIIRWVDGAMAFFNSIKDETIKSKYQEQLRKARAEAEAASAAKSALMANISHEIRTPMTSIVSFSELALDSEIAPKTREYLNMIKENSTCLLQIINNVLDISKVESGITELEIIPFDLNELLKSCKSIILPRAIEKKLSLQFSAAAAGKEMLGDPAKLRQVLLNLLSNAVKFTDSGSVSLSVSVKNESENQITLQFEVKDSGIGMTSDLIKRLSEPFMQADTSAARKYSRTGLGLTIAKNILDLMGSKLRIKSGQNTGTAISFDLTFDIADTAGAINTKAEKTVTAKELDRPSFKGEILVCEDNQMYQRIISEHLTRVGLSFKMAENGQEGIDKVRSRMNKGMKPFDLILMDIHMPIMDGIEAAPKIMALGTGSPIIAMTANIMPDDREQYKTAGMFEYLGKPFTSQELWKCLLKYLKPVSFSSSKNNESESREAKLRLELKIDFVKSNQTTFDEIKKAANAGDIKLACKLAHILKNNAAMIDMSALQKASEAIEAALRNGENRAAEAQWNILQKELSAALDELSPRLAGTTDGNQPENAGAALDVNKALELLKKMRPLLQSGSPESLKMIDDLKVIPGSGELIQQMEDFYFGAAVKALEKLKENLENNTNGGSEKHTNEVSEHRLIITNAFNKALEIINSRNEKTFDETLTKGFSEIAYAMNIDRIIIYRYTEINGESRQKQIIRWDRDVGGLTAASFKHLPNNQATRGWQSNLMQNRFINLRLSEMSEDEAAFLGIFGIKSILMAPVFVNGKYWGFAVFQDHKKERRFDENCMDLLLPILHSCANSIEKAA